MSQNPAESHPFRSRLGLSPRLDRVVLIGALGILSAVSPMATDVYLASMPDISEYFDSTASLVQLTLTTYMIGIALGQFVLGPLSDVLGRHKLVVAGNALFVVASLGIVFAPTIEVVLALRAVQGVAGAAGVVIARAMVSDMTTGRIAAQLYSILALITSLAPVVAPLLGGVIATLAHWQTVFWVLTGFGLVMLACSVFVIPETLPKAMRSQGGMGRIVRNAITVVKDRRFTLYALTFAFGFGSLFSYVSASSFVIQNVMGYSALAYSVIFAVNAAGAIVTAMLNTRLVKTHEPRALLLVGVIGMSATACLNMILVLLGVVGIPTLILLFLMQSCIGFIFGNAVALAQDRAHAHGLSGTGSAVVGMSQFVLGGIVSPLSGLAGDHSAVPMVVTMAGCALVALGTVLAARK
ncbi:multidrug effflux MFS transporter [Kocuria sp. cx-455]|uniref:multidrug effflux MFS transporter n=1 Tax=Kocuria sp. cx-455 TaxID=2771377 RepID=UPI0016860B30|nr:multidrug effflux MFS transporter [Kocuria sp. cx-455]MBD2764095.1 multidrug effflux MFS transporter [Kocuria sp. cx-455]